MSDLWDCLKSSMIYDVSDDVMRFIWNHLMKQKGIDMMVPVVRKTVTVVAKEQETNEADAVAMETNKEADAVAMETDAVAMETKVVATETDGVSMVSGAVGVKQNSAMESNVVAVGADEVAMATYTDAVRTTDVEAKDKASTKEEIITDSHETTSEADQKPGTSTATAQVNFRCFSSGYVHL